MKVSKINSISNINIAQKQSLNETATNAIKQNNQILNNSLSEAIGRSLVLPFSGIRKSQPRTIIENFPTMKRGQIQYDRKTGDCTIYIKGVFGTKSEKLFNRKEESEAIITKTDKGVKKVTITPTQTITQLFNAKKILKEHEDFSELEKSYLDMRKKEVYRFIEHNDGRTTLLRYDEDQNRRIQIKRINGTLQEAKIWDVKTNNRITSGDRIFDTEYDEVKREYVTKNLLTDFVTKRVRYLNGFGKRILSKTTYYKDSKIPNYIYQYNSAHNKEIRKYMDKKGKLKETRITDLSKRSTEIVKYDTRNGKVTHKKKQYYGYSSNPKVKYETIYNPENNDIQETIEYKNGYKILTLYTRSDMRGENRPTSIEYINEGKVYKYIRLREDGETPSSEININGMDEASYAEFAEKGNLNFINYFDSKNNLRTSVEYDKDSDRVVSVTQYNEKNKGYTQYTYLRDSKCPASIIEVDSDNKIKCTLNYNQQNMPKKISKTYYERGEFDLDWLARKCKGDKTPIGDTKENILARMKILRDISKNARRQRQNNMALS